MASRLLIVDDDDGIRCALTDVLQDAGYVVESATDGREALDYLLATPTIDLIILDLSMPVMDGFEFRRRALADDGLRGIPVIVLTAGLMKDGASLRMLQAAAYLSKTTPMPTLLATIANALSSTQRPSDLR
ncbi:MAG TPA: response regulator [Kofleriaceae bacterium]|nr:response regulator [Kofleriaceae bacterium]